MPTTSLSIVLPGNPRSDARHRSWIVVAAVWVKQLLCGLLGHEYQLHAAPDRIYLQCSMCDRQTPGWVIGALALRQPHRHGAGPL